MAKWIQNKHIAVEVDASNGRLLGLTPADRAWTAVKTLALRYRCDGRLYSELESDADADRPQIVRARATRAGMTATLRTPHMELVRTLALTSSSPLLRIRHEITGLASASLHGPALLVIDLADDLLDVMRDEKDCYFDGAELGDGRELPCWRVLYCQGHRRGVFVATRSKLDMSHVMYTERQIEIYPHVRAQQQVDYTLRQVPVLVSPGSSMVVELELGPWQSRRHGAILRGARLDRPARVAVEPAAAPPKLAEGHIVWLADVAPARATVKGAFHPRRWLRTSLPWDRGRATLVCNAGCRPPSFRVTPPVSGPCRVWVGGSRAASVGLKFAGDPYPAYRYGIGGTAFHSVLQGEGQAAELDFGVVDLNGGAIEVVANHNGHWPARLDYLRFAPLPAPDADAWRAGQRRQPPLPIRGLPDCGDVFFYLLDRHRLDPGILKGNLWEQARAGITRVYWQMHGSLTNFHTKIGTRIPMWCKGHGAFEPQIKGAVLFHRKHDLLRLAMQACAELGVECWGATRMNSYMSGKRDRFFQEHPQYAEINESGTWCGNKICYAIPQVRAYQRSILVEAARYGLPGILLGFLRHPPMSLYHPALVSGFLAKFGRLPPREPARPDPHHVGSLPSSDPHWLEWYAFRAGFITQFVRELRQDLREAGLGHVKLAAWVRPNHCLFDGIDLELWLREGLCDEVVADIYSDATLDEPTPQWSAMVRAKAPLIRGIGFGQHLLSVTQVKSIMDRGADGLCVYGSEQFAQTSANQPLLNVMRGR